MDGPYHSSIVLRRRSRALLLEGFQTAWVGAKVEGGSEPDMGDEADMGSTIAIGGTKRGSKELESEDLVELLGEVKLEDLDEEQIIKGTGSCNLDVMALSLPSDDSSYSYLQTPYRKGMGAID